MEKKRVDTSRVDMYYMRKLCVYNLSVFDLGYGKGSGYLWSEANGMRGSSEIATCLRLYLLSLPSEVEHILDHKFLESDHTHMKCDSIHSAIEFAKKKTQIFVPSQGDTVISMARRKDPYMKHENESSESSVAKKMDLLSLCKSGMILKEFHEYYKTFPSNSSVVDKLPQPDAE
ncbi:hypothetical protein MAR_025025 [Mya arenaria]|uniref:Uncharacterized protein n=1 Tax=Mya arenaria TaxID=6604 RepID=A0ABY7DVF0_MYAAR|nr:hypothetical protein MAR_025025 [Mya arenaria]